MDRGPATINNSTKQALAILQRSATAQMELVMSLFMTVEMLIQSFAATSALWRGFREMVPRLIMKTSSAQPQFVSWFSIAPRVVHFAALMKPRVMLLSVFTAAVGLMIAPTHADPILGTIAILAIAGGAGAAGALNMWYDADIDSVMTRTAMRPIPRGRQARRRSQVRQNIGLPRCGREGGRDCSSGGNSPFRRKCGSMSWRGSRSRFPAIRAT
jgi:hypothetical protein